MRICQIYNPKSSFERNDLQILSKHYDISPLASPSSQKDWLRYRRALSELVPKSDLVFTWFGNWHSYFAMRQCRSHNKKLIVVAGGYDVARVPEIQYGAWCNLKERYPAKRTLENADLVISVSKSNEQELLDRVKPRANVLVYNGVDTARFSPGEAKADQVMCVANSLNESNLKRKGLKTLLQSAHLASDLQFYVVGKPAESTKKTLDSLASPNVHFTGFLSDQDLLRMYQKSRIYTQPSCHEGFGVAVVESMLCGCVPVVSDRYALPEVAGDIGVVVPYGDHVALAKAFLDLIGKDLTRLEEKARERAVFFSLERREAGLVKTISDFFG